MRRLFLLLVCLAPLLLTISAEAQETLEDARERRTEIQSEAADKASEIDVLNAEDADIVAALEAIDTWIDIQDSNLDAAEQELVTAQEAEAEALAAAADIDDIMTDLEDQLSEQSITTYMEGFRPPALLEAADVNDVAVLQFMLDESTGRAADTSDLLRLAVDRQVTLQEEAQAAADEAVELQGRIETTLAELESSRADQVTLRQAIDERIAGIEAETELLATEDQRIADFILDEEARIAEEQRLAAEEATRLASAAEAARLAALATPTPPPTAQPTAAPTSGPTPTPGGAPTPTAAPAATPAPAPTAQPPASPTATPAPRTGAPSLIWPVGGSVGSRYGNRVHPIFGTTRFHSGVDINGGNGTSIGAAAGGTVISAGWRDGYGNTVIVDHGGGYSTLYAHMSGFEVSTGDSVSQGSVVGYVGSTGWSTGPHLHFEVRLNGATIDPASLLP